MSLKNLELPASVLADLYTNCLVEGSNANPNSSKKTEKKREETKPAYLGGNEKKILIVVDEKNYAFISDNDLEWLEKMLLACKLLLADVAIINIQTKRLSIAQMKSELKPKKLLMLGPTPADLELPLHFPMFKVQEHDQCSYLCAPAPSQLNQETQEGKILKTKLWVSLKQLFEL
jgi:hypothetical protein